MIAFNRIFAVLGFALVSAQAQAVDFSFAPAAGALTQGNGNTYTHTDAASGLTLSATAWSNANRAEKFQAATLSINPAFGMGICSGSGCGFDSNLDNASAGSDMILFSFSRAVTLQSLNVQQIGSDSDLSLWAGTGSSFSPLNMKPTKLGTASLFENTSSVAGVRNVDLTAYTGTYDWIAVAARIGQIDDLATLKSLTVASVAQPVPETASWMTLLAGLGLVGFRASRRTHT